MKVEYVNPFINASYTILESYLGQRPKRGDLRMQPASFTSQECNIVVGVTGQVAGQIIYGMSIDVAKGIAGAMLGQNVQKFDQLASSAIAELANMLSGNASGLLSENGYVCDITPPTIICGKNVMINTLTIPTVVIPIVTRVGEFSLSVGLVAKK